jgi:hypothetical protein
LHHTARSITIANRIPEVTVGLEEEAVNLVSRSLEMHGQGCLGHVFRPCWLTLEAVGVTIVSETSPVVHHGLS